MRQHLEKKTKVLVITIILLAVFVFLLGGVIKLSSSEADTNLRQGICITDGSVCTYDVETTLFLKHDGDYRIFADWSCDENVGFISAVCVTGPDRTTVLDCTGDYAHIESEKQHLKAGEYHVVIKALASEEDFKNYCNEHNLYTPDNSSSFTDYATDGFWTMNYHISIGGGANTSSTLFIVLFLGFAIGILIVAIIFITGKNDSGCKTKYDERQQEIRTIGYKRAFFTLVGYFSLYAILDSARIDLHAASAVIVLLGIMIAACVLTTTCIWNDAYFAMNEDPKKIKIGLLLIGIANLLIGIANSASSGLMRDGKLSFPAINLLCAFLFAYLFVLFLLKDLHDKKEDLE